MWEANEMKCPKCQKNNVNWADYCVSCGSRLTPVAVRRSGLSPEADGVPEIKRHLDEMAVRLTNVEDRVTLISERMGLERLEGQRPVSSLDEAPKSELQPEVPGESSRVEVPAMEATAAAVACQPAPAVPEAAGSPMVSQLPQKPPKRPKPSEVSKKVRDWEQSLPGNWLSRIGMLALFIGLGFLTQWAYTNDKLVRLPLLLVGLACGGVLLFAGHHWRKDYGAWAQALTGGGISVLYLSFFASYALYDKPVMHFYWTFGLMFLVTILAVGIALRRDSMAIAIIGIVGAFLVPIILGASDLHKPGDGATDSSAGLMIAYILVLDAGIVGLSALRKWRWFTLLGFAGSLAVYGLWYATAGHDGSVSAAEWSLTGVFLCFAVATTLFHVVWRRTPELTDLALMSTNAAVYFCVSYALLWGDYQEWLGLFSVGMSILYAMMGYLAWSRSDENRRLSLFAFAISVVFLTIAIPVQLHRSHASWITAAWAVEGAALIWIAVRQKMPKWELWGIGALAMALVGLFVYNGIIDQERFRPFINDTFWAFTVSILAFYAAAFFLRRDEDALQPWFFPAMMLAASFLTMWLFSGEIVGAAGSKIIEAHNRGASFLEVRNIENARSLGLISLWAAYGFCLLVAGVRKNWDWLRVAAYGLMAVACVVTVVLLNHSHAMVRSSDSQPFINFAFGAFAICTVGLYLFARVITENKERLGQVDTAVCVVALGSANALTLWALSAEITTFLAGSEEESLKKMMLAILWSGYGLLLILVGAWKSLPLARLGGYGCVAVAAGIALIALNHGATEEGPANSNWIANWSFGGLFVCICAIYLAAYLMANHSKKLLDAEKVILPVLIVAANTLSVYALSSELLTYVPSGYGKSMGLTLLWATYGLVVIVVGIAGKWRWVRLGGLALVSVSILKLFVVDTFTLHSGYRVAAYITLGVLLLAGGFVYHRYADVIKGFIMDRPEKEGTSGRK
jgi:Predicted membrane protein (DUF2339)